MPAKGSWWSPTTVNTKPAGPSNGSNRSCMRSPTRGRRRPRLEPSPNGRRPPAKRHGGSSGGGSLPTSPARAAFMAHRAPTHRSGRSAGMTRACSSWCEARATPPRAGSPGIRFACRRPAAVSTATTAGTPNGRGSARSCRQRTARRRTSSSRCTAAGMTFQARSPRSPLAASARSAPISRSPPTSRRGRSTAGRRSCSAATTRRRAGSRASFKTRATTSTADRIPTSGSPPGTGCRSSGGRPGSAPYGGARTRRPASPPIRCCSRAAARMASASCTWLTSRMPPSDSRSKRVRATHGRRSRG